MRVGGSRRIASAGVSVLIATLAVGCSDDSPQSACPQTFASGIGGAAKVSKAHVQSPPKWRTWAFAPEASAILPGTGSTARHDVTTWCNGQTDPADRLAGLTIVALPDDHDVCRVDGKYNHADFPVAAGRLRRTPGGADLAAWRIEPPKKRAGKFISGGHGIRLCLPERKAYAVYVLRDGRLEHVARFDAANVQPGSGHLVPGLTVHDIHRPTIIALAPLAADVSSLHKAPDGIEAATLHEDAIIHAEMTRYPAPGRPFDGAQDFAYGLSDFQNRWGHNRHFWFLPSGAGHSNGPSGATTPIRFVWRVVSGDRDIYLSRISGDRLSIEHTKLPHPAGADDALAAATGDKAGVVFCLLIQRGDGAPLATRKATLLKVDAKGNELLRRKLDSSAGAHGLNIVRFWTPTIPWFAAMRLSGGSLALQLARTMHQGSDGLTHQGEIGVVFAADTLDIRKHHGQLAGHSLGNRLEIGHDGRFVSLSLGDNQPRGIVLTRYDDKTLQRRVVYAFKTMHGADSANPAGTKFPYYRDDAAGKPMYRWSNDNNTYTELGGVITSAQHHLVLFAGERPPLANEAALSQHNAARNLGLVKVRPDFEAASKVTGKTSCGAGFDNVVTDDLVLGAANASKGGFYDFQGDWCDQRTTGVTWLTDYKGVDENVSRLGAHKLENGQVLVTWERWSADAFRDAWLLRLDADGKPLSKPTKLHPAVRLSRRGDRAVGGDRLVTIRGHAGDRMLELVRLK